MLWHSLMIKKTQKKCKKNTWGNNGVIQKSNFWQCINYLEVSFPPLSKILNILCLNYFLASSLHPGIEAKEIPMRLLGIFCNSVPVNSPGWGNAVTSRAVTAQGFCSEQEGLDISAWGHGSPAGSCGEGDEQALGAGLDIVGHSPADSHSSARTSARQQSPVMSARNPWGARTTCSSLPGDSWVNQETDVTGTAEDTGLLHPAAGWDVQPNFPAPTSTSSVAVCNRRCGK